MTVDTTMATVLHDGDRIGLRYQRALAHPRLAAGRVSGKAAASGFSAVLAGVAGSGL